MRVVVQRVKQASVVVDNAVCGEIQRGLLVFLGIHKEDRPEQTLWLVNKLKNLRIFSDEQGKMNLSVQDIKGEILVVSQFTLYGDCTDGRRPDFTKCAAGLEAVTIYEKFVAEVKAAMGSVQTGIFGAKMEVSLLNDGPVTFIIESPL